VRAPRLLLAGPLLALCSVLAAPTQASAQSRSVLTLVPTEGRRLEVGAEQSGALSNADLVSPEDRFLEAWELSGRSGELVTIDLLTDAFDPRLFVVGPGLAETLADDDGGDGCNARLTFTFLETGTFVVAASSSGPRETGPYTIRVSDQPGPPPAYECGQVSPEKVLSMPTDGRTVRMGSVASGQVTATTPIVQEGRAGEAWDLEGRAGERVFVVLESDDFDSFLYLAGPGMDQVLTDDDGAGDLNSGIAATLPADGPYRIVASTLTAGSTGAYTLRVEEPADVGALPTDGRMVNQGQTVEGRLEPTAPVILEGRRGQVWGVEGVAGQSFVIDLVSDDFDSYLYFGGPGLTEPLEDDDGGDALNSRLAVTLPETGTYRIVVSSLSDGSGAFTLSVTP